MKKLLTLFFGFILAFCFIPMQNYNVVNAMETNQDIISTYEVTTNLVNAPTVVYELQTKKDVDSLLESDVKPSNVILSFDENAVVLETVDGDTPASAATSLIVTAIYDSPNIF